MGMPYVKFFIHACCQFDLCPLEATLCRSADQLAHLFHMRFDLTLDKPCLKAFFDYYYFYTKTF